MSNTTETPRMQIAIDGKVLDVEQSKALVATLVAGLELYIDKFDHVTPERGQAMMRQRFYYLFRDGAQPMTAHEADETKALLMPEIFGEG